MLGLKPILTSSVRASKMRSSPVEVSGVVSVYMQDNTELIPEFNNEESPFITGLVHNFLILFLHFIFLLCSAHLCYRSYSLPVCISGFHVLARYLFFIPLVPFIQESQSTSQVLIECLLTTAWVRWMVKYYSSLTMMRANHREMS